MPELGLAATDRSVLAQPRRSGHRTGSRVPYMRGWEFIVELALHLDILSSL